MKPVIGISANLDGEERTYYLKDYYVASTLSAGGIPVILPAVCDYEIIKSYTSICNAFIISGGGDADPAYWQESPVKDLGEINPIRDNFEINLIRNIMEHNLPLLGICRGCQLINIASGGSIVQDIKGNFQHQQNAPRNYAFHWIFIDKYSKLAEIIKNEKIRVNSFHHQAVKIPGTGLRIAACSSDGTVEAIESTVGKFTLGVQWHPECMDDACSYYLFKSLVDAAIYNIIEKDR